MSKSYYTELMESYVVVMHEAERSGAMAMSCGKLKEIQPGIGIYVELDVNEHKANPGQRLDRFIPWGFVRGITRVIEP